MGLIVAGMVLCELFSAVTLVVLCRRRMAGLPRVPAEPGLDRRICSIAVPIGLTALLGNLMGSANAVLIPQRLVASGCDVSEAMSAFGVLCGMTVPMLAMPHRLHRGHGAGTGPPPGPERRPGADGPHPGPYPQGHAGHIGAHHACHGLSGGAGTYHRPCSLPGGTGRRLHSPALSGDAPLLLSVGPPASSTEWGSSAPPPGTPSSPERCSWAAPVFSWACPVSDSGAMWPVLPPAPPWVFSSTGGRSAAMPGCAPGSFSGAPLPPSPPCSWGCASTCSSTSCSAAAQGAAGRAGLPGVRYGGSI